MYRVLITDDEKIEREGIKFLLAQEEGEYEIHEAANGRQALNVLRSEEIDFLLTDIKMPHMDGLELASKVREEYPNLPIVIFSGYSDFAFAQEAMRYGVKDYVLKPVPYFAFSQQLQKAAGQLARRARRYLAVPVDGGMRRLDEASVYYIESEGHRIHFYTEDGDFSAPGALKAWEEKLEPHGFARCNSGYLVNLAYVSSVRMNTVQVGPHQLQVSRPRRKAFLEALADYIGENGA